MSWFVTEGIAPAMSEEQNATDDPFAVDRKLTAKVNKPLIYSLKYLTNII